MSLDSGTKLGPYEILAPIGAGGMGEIYKAKDTRLDRTVAIKVLPSHLSGDAERRQRFEREARAVSSLNHPHICTLHDIGEQDGTDFLVMEYIEGESLADRMKKGALPLDQTLRHAIEIADALDKAHRQGVVHRDLKPGNIMLTKSGVKLLDFGLAKLKASETGQEASVLSALPTEEKPLTEKGSILGTFQYMAPEQLEGKEADARTDIFAFGAVLYEMVTGRRAFQGKSQASLISAIMSSEPRPISEFSPVATSALDRVVKKCLAKEPDGRWQTALDLRDEIVWIHEVGGQQERTIAKKNHARWIAALAATAIAVGIGVWVLTSSPIPTPTPKHFAIPLPPAVTLPSARGTLIAIAPDGTKLAFMGERDGVEQIFLRSIDEPDVHAIPGTAGARHPAFSPGGDEIAFDVNGRPYKMPLPSGPLVSLAEAGVYPTWGSDGYIYYWNVGLWRIPSNGGEALPLTPSVPMENLSSTGRPNVLPSGKAVLYEGRDADGTRTVELLLLESGEIHSVVAEGSNPRYVTSGHILFARSGMVFAVPFDAEVLRVTGRPVPVGRGVRTELGGAAQFAVAHDGSLVYARGAIEQRGSLVRVDREGQVRPIGDSRVGLHTPRVSPDGKRVAVQILTDVWIYEVNRDVMTRLTFDSVNTSPIWSPDGRRIAFSRSMTVFVRSVLGGEEAQPLTSGDFPRTSSWSSDGGTIILTSWRPDTQWDIDVVRLDDGKRATILGTRFEEAWGVLSPDDRWLAYMSNESGRFEVFIVSFPEANRKRQISTEGGTEPMWARDGRELFYRSGDKMMSVAIETEPELTLGKPEILFEAPYAVRALSTNYDVAPNEEGFIMIQRQTGTCAELDVILNWFEELKRLVPTN